MGLKKSIDIDNISKKYPDISDRAYRNLTILSKISRNGNNGWDG